MRAHDLFTRLLLGVSLVLTGSEGLGDQFGPQPRCPETLGKRFESTRRWDAAIGTLGAGSRSVSGASETEPHLTPALVAVAWDPSVAQDPGPLSLDQIQKLIVIAPDSVVAGEVRERGVSFRATSRLIDQLKELGAGSETIKVLKSLIPPNHQPSVAVEAEKTDIRVGETVPIRARASDPDDDPLQYRWFTSDGSLEGDGPVVNLQTAGLTLDSDSITVLVGLEVDDGRGGIAREAVSLSVKRPNRLPTVSLKPDRTEIEVGQSLTLTAKASDPDGDELEYIWSTTAGVIEGVGPTVSLKTEGTAIDSNPFPVTVSLEVRDGQGGTVTESVAVSLKRPRPVAILPPEAVHKVLPTYPPFARSARITGQVIVEVTINESGDVASARAVDGPGLLQSVAIDAVKKWKFRPARRGDQPIEYTQRVVFDFKP